jgi:hypothetical protein
MINPPFEVEPGGVVAHTIMSASGTCRFVKAFSQAELPGYFASTDESSRVGSRSPRLLCG